MAINTRAYDWSTNNFGLSEWDDIGWAFSELGAGQFFNSYSADNFTAKDTPDDFDYTAVSAASSPSLSPVSAASSTNYTALTISSATFTDIVIAGEN